jgi:hypothetical protein
MLAVLALGLGSTGALANSYADDRALIENMSNRYMVAGRRRRYRHRDGHLGGGWRTRLGRGRRAGREAIREAMSHFGGGAIMGTLPADATERRGRGIRSSIM